MLLNELFEKLDRLADSIPPQTLLNLLGKLAVENAIVPYLRFEHGKYQRNLINRTPHYEALLLCFEPGQQTPIHDHAGSACGVKIITGTATEITYKRHVDGLLSKLEKTTLIAGRSVSSNDMDIHSLGNLEQNERLASLHIYSPPLGKIGNYLPNRISKTGVTAENHQGKL